MRLLRIAAWLTIASVTLAPLMAQESARRSASRVYDINGHPIDNPSTTQIAVGNDHKQITTARSLNGRETPVESVEQRVISDANGVKVVERIVRRYDPNGNPGPAEKTVIEERANADGTSTVRTETHRTDINGHMQLTERAVTEIQKSGDVETVNTSIERASVNGGLAVAERRRSTARKTDAGETEEVVTQRRGEGGGFFEAARVVTDRSTRDGAAVENVAIYESQGQGQLTLVGQQLKKTVARGDGSSVTEVNVYSSDIAGRASGAPQLKEQQLIERSPGSGGNVVETLSVRRPSVNDPNRLGRFEKVSERVCSGDCNSKPAAAEKPEEKVEAKPDDKPSEKPAETKKPDPQP